MFRSNPEDMDAYLSEENAKFRFENILKGKFEEGRAEGLEEGRAEGLEEGRAEGRAEGQTETTSEIARRMLKAGLSVDLIKQTTFLSDAEIAAL